MVIKAAKLRLRPAEVPVRFFKDREGRESHHKRTGWWSPWAAGWRNLSVMLLYAPDFFLVVPGLVMLVLGLVLSRRARRPARSRSGGSGSTCTPCCSAWR